MEPRVLLAADPIISEILAVTGNGLRDEDNQTSDWIEVHNAGDQTIDLEGWYLSDDPEQLTKWQFPRTILAADSRVVVFASDKNRREPSSELHTNFRLSSEGEFLALIEADGTTIASQFVGGFPAQREDISYGLETVEEVTTLVGASSPAKFIVPDAVDDARIANLWTGRAEPFDDSAAAGWTSAFTGIGFDVISRRPSIPGTIVQSTAPGTAGNQSFTGRLGADFVVNQPISITALGTFDDQSDGFTSNVHVEIWLRHDSRTPSDARDDTGVLIVASETFTPVHPGILVGGSRFKPLRDPIVLGPGNYTIVASGYGENERNGNTGGGWTFGELASSPAISLDGAPRIGPDAVTAFPTDVDTGPAFRYAAGTFAFVEKDSGQEAASPDRDDQGPVVAYRTRPGAGNATFEGNLGMDFEVVRPIRVSQLGVFDSNQDGIKGNVAVSLWSLTGSQGVRLAWRTFERDAGELAPGTGSRFQDLDAPLILDPGFYSIVASGFLGEDLYSRDDLQNPRNGVVETGNGAVEFLGTSRTSFFSGSDRFVERPHHRLPERLDIGPVNRFAAGSFKFEPISDGLIESEIGSHMYRVNTSAYVRIPFQVPDLSEAHGLRLNTHFDDGFVAYINGVEVARRNAPTNLTWDSRARGRRPDDGFVDALSLDISEHLGLLRSGETSILAFHALNSRIDDADLVLSPQLESYSVTESRLAYFDEPTPGSDNGKGFSDLATSPQFSSHRGIVTQADRDENGQFLVELLTPTESARIYYTTNGSEPDSDRSNLYEGPLVISETTTLRAATFKDGLIPSEVRTQTYLFLEDVVLQPDAPEDFPSHWNGVTPDYGMSQNPDDLPLIAGDPEFTVEEARGAIRQSLSSLPTLSIVMDPEDLFGPVNGVYSNPYPRGRPSERPASVELILPDGSQAFQVDAGLRMMGWTSRIPSVSPKHSLRIVFRDQFGPGRLEYPFFGDMGVESFDTISLRSNSRDSWISDFPFGQDPQHPPGGSRDVASYIRDQWSRVVQRDMGHLTATGNFVHLYLNGLYWGVYNPTERPDAAFASEHLGGNEEDYDAVTFCNPTTRVADGDLRKWNELLARADAGLDDNASFQRILGNNPDGTRNPDFEVLLNLDNFIDYIIGAQFDAASDWPCNFYAIRKRGEDSDGFRFLQWDNDLIFPMFANAQGRSVTDVRASRLDIDVNGGFFSTPWRIEVALRENDEYLVRYADALQRHLFNDGVLTADANIARWTEIAQQVEPALIAESARWGDYRRDVDESGPAELYTPSQHWHSFHDHMVNEFFPVRGQVFLEELRRKGLFPRIDAPIFSQHGGGVEAGFELEMAAQSDEIWFTLDGSDPRLAGGETNPDAILYSGPVRLSSSVTVKARSFDDGQWSALNEALFAVDPQLRVTEVMYNPQGDEDLEFIELRNVGSQSIDLTGFRFTRNETDDGIDYEFRQSDANRTLAPGQFIVIAGHRESLLAAYPGLSASMLADRQFDGRLSNSGETITLMGALGDTIQQFTYDDQWYDETDGRGRSLVIVDQNGELSNWDQRSGWRPSGADGGSPGAMDFITGNALGVGSADANELFSVMLSFAKPGKAIPVPLGGDGMVVHFNALSDPLVTGVSTPLRKSNEQAERAVDMVIAKNQWR